ncbi:MAG: ribosome maturation factor RimP [Acidobacteriota bacterium]|nr:ribosome maturation factor RimP [Acidobacteriota bacterium]
MGLSHQDRLDGLSSLAREAVVELGLEFVELLLQGSSRHRTLIVIIDRAGIQGVTHDDCKRVTQSVGERLDESPLLPDAYNLEVSSPGIDRPIRTEDDIRRNIGREIMVTTTEPIEGATEFRGLLVGGDRTLLRIERPTSGGALEIPISAIDSARQHVGI